MVLAVDVDERLHARPRLVDLVGGDELVDLALQAAAEAEDALAVAGQRGLVGARLVVETVEVGLRHDSDEVAVTGRVLDQQRKVRVGLAPRDRPLLRQIARRQVDLAADDRVDPCLQGFLLELHRAVEVAVVGQCYRRHPEVGHAPDQILDPDRPVEERILAVQVEMDEAVGHPATLAGGDGRSKDHTGRNRPGIRASGFLALSLLSGARTRRASRRRRRRTAS